MTTLKKEFEKEKQKKLLKREKYTKWTNALLFAVKNGKKPNNMYVDLEFNSKILSLFLHFYRKAQVESINNLVKELYKHRAIASDMRIRMNDNNIDQTKFIIYCFMKLVEMRPKFFKGIVWFYQNSLREFDNWINEDVNESLLREMYKMMEYHVDGKDLIVDLKRLKTI